MSNESKKIPLPGLVGGWGQNLEKVLAPQTLQNMYVLPESEAEGGALYRIPGTQTAQTLPQGERGRNMLVYNGYLYIVCSQFVYKLDRLLNPTKLGELPTDNGYVAIQANFNNQITFFDGVEGWVWDDNASTWTQITLPTGLVAPGAATMSAAQFVVGNIEGANTYVSGVNTVNFTSNELTQSITSVYDKLVGIGTLNRSLFLFGEISGELWRPALGPSEFPFPRDNQVNFNYGLAARGAFDISMGKLVFLANSTNGIGPVMVTEGQNPQSITPAPILQQFNRVADNADPRIGVTDASSFIYQIEGHTFYQLNFTEGNESWLVDLTTGQWCKLVMNDGSRHKAQDHAYFYGKHYIIEYDSAKILEYSHNYVSYDGENYIYERILPLFYEPGKRQINVDEIIIDTKVGSATDVGIDSDPFLELSVSVDRGLTWSAAVPQGLGQHGDYTFFTKWLNVGRGRELTFRLRCYNKIDFMILDATIGYSIVGQ